MPLELEDEHWLVATELSPPTSVTAACAGHFVAHGAAAAPHRPQLAVARQHRLDIWQRCAEDDEELQLLLSATLVQRIDHLAALPGAPGGADGLLVVASCASVAPDGAACADVSVWVAVRGAGGALSLARCARGGPPCGPLPRAAASAGGASGGAAAGGARGPPRLEGPLATPLERACPGHAGLSGGAAAWLLALAAHADEVQALRTLQPHVRTSSDASQSSTTQFIWKYKKSSRRMHSAVHAFISNCSSWSDKERLYISAYEIQSATA